MRFAIFRAKNHLYSNKIINEAQKQRFMYDSQLSIPYPRWLFIWWLLLGLINILWLTSDTRPPTWDPFSHLLSSLKYTHAIQDIFQNQVSFSDAIRLMIHVDDFYPPFAPFIVSLFSLIVPLDPDIATWILNLIFSGLLIIALYRLGSLLYSSEIGFYACLAITSFRYFSNQSRMFMLDLPLTAITTLGVYTLLKTEYFKFTKASIFFGLASALAMLTKWIYLFFILVPLIYTLCKILRSDKRFIRIINFAISCFAWALLCLPWYLIHFTNLLTNFSKYGYHLGSREGDPQVLSFKSFTYYLSSLPSFTLIPWFILFLIGIIYYLRNQIKKNPILALWFLGGYFIFTLMRNKDVRFIMALLPAVALFATGWLQELKLSKKIRHSAIVALAIYSLGNAFYFEPPMIQYWPLEEAFEFIREQKSYHPVIRLRVIPDHPYLERNAFKYYTELERFPLKVSTWSGHFPSLTDVIITKTRYQGIRDEAHKTMEFINKKSSLFSLTFKIKWRRALPDGSICNIHVRDITPANIPPLRIIREFKSIIRKKGALYVCNPQGAKIHVEPNSDLDTLSGRFRNVALSITSAEICSFSNPNISLPVHNLKIELNDLTINPWKLIRSHTIEFISLMEMKPQFQFTEHDLNAYLTQINKKLNIMVKFQNNAVYLHICLKNTHLCTDIIMKPIIINNENIAVKFTSFKLLGIPLPTFIPQLLTEGEKPLFKHLPFRFHIYSIDLNNGICSVNTLK